MTDTGNLPAARLDLAEAGPAMLAGDFTTVDAHVGAMDDEMLEGTLIGLSQRARADGLLAGRIAFEIRTRTPDGEWGRKVRSLAADCQVSDRTIHRWMSSYQAAAGLELTPAQVNARASADRASAPSGLPDREDDWDDDEETDAAGLSSWEEAFTQDGLAGQQATRESVGEPWAEPDSVTPSTKYENPPDRPAARRPVVPADHTWLEFTASQIAAEHPALAGQAAERNAKAKWDRMVREEPLDLLEDLEQIYGDAPPDELVQALYAAEEAKLLKPEVVEQPEKKKRSGGSGGSPGRVTKESVPRIGLRNVENGMAYAREVHAHLKSVLEEGGEELLAKVYGDALGNMQAWAYALDGCMKLVRKALEAEKARQRTKPTVADNLERTHGASPKPDF